MAGAFVWVFGGLLITAIGAYALNSLGFRDYIDGIIAAFRGPSARQAYRYQVDTDTIYNID